MRIERLARFRAGVMIVVDDTCGLVWRRSDEGLMDDCFSSKSTLDFREEKREEICILSCKEALSYSNFLLW